MANIIQTQAADIELNKLERRIEDLVSIASKLKEENDSLHASHAPLLAERSILLEKNEKIRMHVEAMISRLKAMEK